MLKWNDHRQSKARKIPAAVMPQNPAHLLMVSYPLDSELPNSRSEKENIISLLPSSSPIPAVAVDFIFSTTFLWGTQCPFHIKLGPSSLLPSFYVLITSASSFYFPCLGWELLLAISVLPQCLA